MKKGKSQIPEISLLCIVLLIALVLVSCQTKRETQNINMEISQLTGKDVKIFERADTLVVALEGSIDSIAHESLGNALNVLVVSVINKHRAVKNGQLLTTLIYAKENNKSPGFIYVNDEAAIKNINLIVSTYPNFIDRLEFFVKSFSAKGLSTLDYVTNSLMDYENHSRQGQGFINLFWETQILCSPNGDNIALEIGKTILEIAVDPELCPNCDKRAIVEFFEMCKN